MIGDIILLVLQVRQLFRLDIRVAGRFSYNRTQKMQGVAETIEKAGFGGK